MDENHVKASDILSTLSMSEVKGLGQFKTLISMAGSSIHHDKNPFQQISSIPCPAYEDQQEKTTNINGCKLHLVSSGYMHSESLPTFDGKVESSCSSEIKAALSDEYQRPRSQSMELVVTVGTLQTSRSNSRDSLGTCSNLLDEYQTPRQNGSSEEALVEMTCNKFKRLSTRGSESPKSLSPLSQSEDGNSYSRSPPFYDLEVGRKFSIGSQLSSAKRQLSSQECPTSPHGLPIDLTCKRKKSDATSASLNSLSIQTDVALKANRLGQTNLNLEESSYEGPSILKSVLVGMARKRSHTFSVRSRQDFKNRNQEAPSGFSLRQRVTLAKRNLAPVMGRMSEHLNKITQFLCSLPDFMKLSSNDQRTLINDSVHRLLMLCMAESNLQFVVTPVRDDEDLSSSEEGKAAQVPTVQFTEAVQNYISKCQAMSISSKEYSYMRIITLFHKGSRMLEDVSLVEKANADAQQNLQSLVQHCYPDDRLRYSKLLLSLYTLFGINCHMLESLFCRHLIPRGNGGLQKFIFTEFMTNRHTDDC